MSVHDDHAQLVTPSDADDNIKVSVGTSATSDAELPASHVGCYLRVCASGGTVYLSAKVGAEATDPTLPSGSDPGLPIPDGEERDFWFGKPTGSNTWHYKFISDTAGTVVTIARVSK